MTHIRVNSGCCSKIPQTRWLIDNRNLYLTVLESGKSKVSIKINVLIENYISQNTQFNYNLLNDHPLPSFRALHHYIKTQHKHLPVANIVSSLTTGNSH